MNSFLGMTIARSIPPEVYGGLLTGQYKLHGGVIRWAAGTEFAGQIVRHLIPVASQAVGNPIFAPLSATLNMVNTYQLQQLSWQVNILPLATQQVLQIATNVALLSGLNLVVSAVSFAIINQKLTSHEGQLSQIQQEIAAIRVMLEQKERSELKAALRDLINVMEIEDPEHRHTMLFNAKNVLAPISLKYKELLEGAETLETAMAYEEYFSLTALAHARCIAELGMINVAQRDLQETKVFWQSQARRITNDLLLGDSPQRFLSSDFAEAVPASTLIAWCDFAYNEVKGYDWLDDLRSKTPPWYPVKTGRRMTPAPGKVFSSLGKMVPWSANAPSALNLSTEQEKIIPSIQKLVARNNVIEGYNTQYQLLEEHNMTPSDFEKQLAKIASTETVEDFIILEPAAKSTNDI